MIAKTIRLLIHFYVNSRLRFNPGITRSGRVQIKGRPIIDVRSGSQLIIGRNVTLNSFNDSYHVNMFAPVKLLSRVPGSIIQIGNNSRIHGACIHAQRRISIGDNCLIAANCQIMDGSGHDLDPNNRLKPTTDGKPIIIEDDVWLATGVIVLPGTTIRRGSVISAGSVVSGTIEAYSLVAGNPAKVVKKLR